MKASNLPFSLKRISLIMSIWSRFAIGSIEKFACHHFVEWHNFVHFPKLKRNREMGWQTQRSWQTIQGNDLLNLPVNCQQFRLSPEHAILTEKYTTKNACVNKIFWQNTWSTQLNSTCIVFGMNHECKKIKKVWTKIDIIEKMSKFNHSKGRWICLIFAHITSLFNCWFIELRSDLFEAIV